MWIFEIAGIGANAIAKSVPAPGDCQWLSMGELSGLVFANPHDEEKRRKKRLDEKQRP